ncbi:MAG: Lrp/AsnC ligand binding domain-containing protein [Candidatus Bathyarchaeota archaeon]|nr:MAG: Lrp/AsnC ligand binding domain-containing protein [Candidatus Bathyarchaeota archaeon]
MLEAYILLRIKPGTDRSVLRSVQKLQQVSEMDTVYGEYDLLMKIQVETMEALDALIFDTVRTIKGVERTTTLIVIEPPNNAR